MSKNPFSDVDFPWKDSRPLQKALKSGKKTGALSIMSPDQFLSHAKPLPDNRKDRLLIESFKDKMKKGKTFKALKLLEDNKADGRHRATAAKELGIKKVPVVDYRDADLSEPVRKRKRSGGGIQDMPYSTTSAKQLVGQALKKTWAKRAKFLKKVPKKGFADGGSVAEALQAIRELPTSFSPASMSDLIGTSSPPTSSPGAYTDVGGQEIAAPFVSKMLSGYPVFGDGKAIPYKLADGGGVEGGVSFLEDEAPLHVARAQEPTLTAYEPTIREKIYGALSGTSEAKPTAERSSFAKGVSDLLGLSPVLGQAMQAQEAARAGDKKGVAMAVLPMPAAKVEGALASRLTNPLGMHSPGAEAARALPQSKGTPEQIIAMLRKTVPEHELQHSGIIEEISGLPSVNTEDVAKHFESNLPQIQETILSKGRKEPKFEEYSLPGGSNYREVILHEPHSRSSGPFKDVSEVQNVHDAALERGDFEGADEIVRQWQEQVEGMSPESERYASSHFPDVPNYLAHLRMKDYELPDGSKGLLVDELQSDRAQEARRSGQRSSAPYMADTHHWTDLTLKRALKEAIEGGHDRLMVTSGEEQAQRYGLRKHLHSVMYNPDTSQFIAIGKNGMKIMDHTIPLEKLDSTIGKEAAEKLLSTEPVLSGNSRIHYLEGEGLETGGHGMKGYYDKTVVRRLDKLIRKYDKDARVEPYQLPAGTSVANEWNGPDVPIEKVEEFYKKAQGEGYSDRTAIKSMMLLSAMENGTPFKRAVELHGNPEIAEYFGGKLDPIVPKRPVHSVRITPEMRQAVVKKGYEAFREGGTVHRALDLARNIARKR